VREAQPWLVIEMRSPLKSADKVGVSCIGMSQQAEIEKLIVIELV
jgi:hypothetical protein